MYTTSDIRNGLKIELNGEPYEIIDFLHAKYGRGSAHIWTKLKNLLTGSVIEYTFRSGEKIQRPDLETKEVQYLYRDGDNLVFMDLDTYEQMYVQADTLGKKVFFLKEGEEIKVLIYNGQIIDVNLPAAVVLEVIETEPGVKGDTVSGATKPATLEGGLTVNVPLFINIGDKIKVDTRTFEYLGRQ